MDQYTEFVLLGILLILFYNKPKFADNLYNNKLALLVLVLLNSYIAKTCGISSGIIMACIIIVLIDKKENFSNIEEGFTPKIQVWRPVTFVGPCQVDLDRKLKEDGELANLNATRQLNGQTNDGFKQKQLY